MKTLSLAWFARSVGSVVLLGAFTAPAWADGAHGVPTGGRDYRLPMPTAEQVTLAKMMDQTPARPVTREIVLAHRAVSDKVEEVRSVGDKKLAEAQLVLRVGGLNPTAHDQRAAAEAYVDVGRSKREAAELLLKMDRPADAALHLKEAAHAYRAGSNLLNRASTLERGEKQTVPELRARIAKIEAEYAGPIASAHKAEALSRPAVDEVLRQWPEKGTRPPGGGEEFRVLIDRLDSWAHRFEEQSRNLPPRAAEAARHAVAEVRQQKEQLVEQGPERYNARYEGRLLVLTMGIVNDEAHLNSFPSEVATNIELSKLVRAELKRMGPERYDSAFDTRLTQAGYVFAGSRAELDHLEADKGRSIAPLKEDLERLEHHGDPSVEDEAKAHNMLIESEALEARSISIGPGGTR